MTFNKLSVLIFLGCFLFFPCTAQDALFGLSMCGGGGGGSTDDSGGGTDDSGGGTDDSGTDDGGVDPGVACPAYSSGLPELAWRPGCLNGDYDFHATLFFCRDRKKYGFRLNQDDPCDESVMSPLIRMQAGKSYQLRLQNEANAETYTNIHTHGLHIPGSGNTDDITRHVHGGECLFYNWTIPHDHMEGTFWYHSHHHGDTYDQVNGGAVSMLLIDPPDDIDFSTRPDWADDMDNDRFMLLGTFWDKPGENGVATDTVNGMLDANIPLKRNTWHRLRIAVADPEALVRDITFDESICQTHLVAKDGVWRTVVPKPAESVFVATGATRMDIAIRCSNDSAVWYRDAVVGDEPLATFTVCDTDIDDDDLTEETLPEWEPARPRYLQSLMDAEVDETFTIFDIDFELGINLELWNESVPLAELTHDTIQEWYVTNTRPHPFHLHMYHMQVVTEGGCGNEYEEGEWYDVFSATVESNANCTVRFHTADVGGRTVMHCHVLRHEDKGVMAWVNVDNAPPNGVDHIGPTPTCASECYGPAP